MFAGRDFVSGTFLLQSGDLVIPVVDLKQHALHSINANNYTSNWDEYFWNGKFLRMDQEGFYKVDGVSPGFGAAVNGFQDLVNVYEWMPHHDVMGMHRSKDPGIGAFTPYFNRQSSAMMDIQTGDELLVHYGDEWFQARTQMIGYVPLSGDLQRATDLAKSYYSLQNEAKVPNTVMTELWDDFVLHSKFQNSHVLAAFSKDDWLNELKQLEHESMHKIHRKKLRHSVEWLEKHGRCADHIVPGPSLLPQAGRGGFAVRYLPQGTVVALLPLIHITDRKQLLGMWDIETTDSGVYIGDLYHRDNATSAIGKQLLLNYCFGHHESSLLLCPYGPMTGYVNHNRTLANVQIQWADPARANHVPQLLQEPLSRLESELTPKLAFELIAKRDIEAGEELYLDYGVKFEQAWQRHVNTWSPVDHQAFSDYVSADQLNEHSAHRVLMTEFETQSSKNAQYPANVQMGCDYNILNPPVFLKPHWNATDRLAEMLWSMNGPLLPCRIQSRQKIDNNEWLYTVIVKEKDASGSTRERIVLDIPREGIHFVDRPYSSDIFLKNAFRHEMQIPDSIFPDVWRNLLELQDE